jgi:hypothetical protein
MNTITTKCTICKELIVIKTDTNNVALMACHVECALVGEK